MKRHVTGGTVHDWKLKLELVEDGCVLRVTNSDRAMESWEGKTDAPDWRSRELENLRRQGHLKSLGEKLRSYLFAGDVTRAFLTEVEALGDADGLRIRLLFDQSARELARLPWEFVLAPQKSAPTGRPLALDPRFSIVRDMRGPTPRIRPGPFRVAYSQGPGLPKDVIAAERDRMREMLGGETLDDIGVADRRSLASSLEKPATVFHFSGHGTPGGIEIAAPDPQPLDLLPAAELAKLLLKAKVQLAVLAACHSGGSEGDSFVGIATTLIEAGVPNVVAMQFAVDDSAAATFAAGFYEVLVDTLSVDAAMTAGRTAVASWGAGDKEVQGEWGTPVIYSSSHHLRLKVATADPAVAKPPRRRPSRRRIPSQPPVAARARGPWAPLCRRGDLAFLDSSAVPCVDGLVVTQDGAAAVALDGTTLRVAWIGGDGRLEPWHTTFNAGAEVRLLAARRAAGGARVTVLVQRGDTAVALGLERVGSPVETTLSLPPLRSAAAIGGGSGFLTLNADGVLGGLPGPAPSGVPAGTWWDVDVAAGAGCELAAFLSLDRKHVTAVLLRRELERRKLTLPWRADAVAVVRPESLDAEPPGEIVLQIRDELRVLHFHDFENDLGGT